MKQLFIGLALSSLFFSCSKTDDNKVNNPNPTVSKTIDATILQTEWEVISYYNLYHDTLGNIIDANGISQTYTGYEVGWENSFKGYITFKNDNTLTHRNADASGEHPLLTLLIPSPGSWQLKDNNKVIAILFESEGKQEILDFKAEEFKADYVHLVTVNPRFNDFNRKGYVHIELKR